MKKSRKILLGFLFGLLALGWFYPFIIVLINALKGKRGVFQNPLWFTRDFKGNKIKSHITLIASQFITLMPEYSFFIITILLGIHPHENTPYYVIILQVNRLINLKVTILNKRFLSLLHI